MHQIINSEHLLFRQVLDSTPRILYITNIQQNEAQIKVTSHPLHPEEDLTMILNIKKNK